VLVLVVVLGLPVVNQSRTKDDDEHDDGEHPGMPDRPLARRRPRSAGRAPIEDERSIGASSPA
jgi:hypothetical protein